MSSPKRMPPKMEFYIFIITKYKNKKLIISQYGEFEEKTKKRRKHNETISLQP